MLFGGTVGTGGLGWGASVPVGIAMGFGVGLLQHFGSPHDNLGLAAGKGIIIAGLTAIPTALPSLLVGGAGAAGAVSMLRGRRQNRLND